MDKRLDKIEDNMSDVKSRIAVAETTIKDVKEDIVSIKDNTTWILRIIVGAIITTLLGLIIKGF
ncbi:hemolysin XhlA family protein [Neobacillus mesonae]|uniref:Hemolysin activation protein n=1 Tax=Neobacillus mesonae TaxID=1193713 RepID=A0A3T0HZ80_9BACI|nr:hemolysin XhlA family protein [Neobacillus mesonae]AZU62431.1 hemolysin activation protein [Neobacillus mesonae]